MRIQDSCASTHRKYCARLALVITAAGSGSRLGYDQPKAFVPVAGIAMIEHVIRRCVDYRHPTLGAYSAIAVSLPQGYEDEFSRIIARIEGICEGDGPHLLDRAEQAGIPVIAVHGGVSRQQSVSYALDGLQRLSGQIGGDDIVLIHDAARCVMPDSVTTRVVDAVRSRAAIGEYNIAVVPGLQAVDTLYLAENSTQDSYGESSAYSDSSVNAISREVIDTDSQSDKLRVMTDVLPRESVYRVQTPQGFIGKDILTAHHEFAAKGADEAQAFGDDAQMILARGGRCFIVQGSPAAIKITVSSDIPIAEEFLHH